MTDPNDVQALQCISNAVDESQLKIILSTQCIKAQAHLVDKLRKQSEQQREVCNFINNGNLKLETEIRIADQKIKRHFTWLDTWVRYLCSLLGVSKYLEKYEHLVAKRNVFTNTLDEINVSMITALETIKSSNVDLQKELLLSKERKSDIVKRVTTGIKKYEDLWQEVKTKYESIPFIKHYQQTKNETHTIKQNINDLINDSKILNKTINEKKIMLAELDKSRVLEMVNYLTKERPKTLTLIKQKRDRIAEINKEIGTLINNHNVDVVVRNVNVSKQTDLNQAKMEEDDELELTKNGDDSMMVLPKLELCYIDLDGLTNKLDKIKKADSFSITNKETTITEHHPNTDRSDCHEDYKMILIDDNMNNKPKNYSEKKLIHILDDIKINDKDTKDILSKVHQNHLRDVKVSEVIFPSALSKQKATNNTNEEKMDDAEEIELTPNKSFVIGPPTQYLDLTEKNNITMEENNTQNSVNNSNKTNEENAGNESDIQLDCSGASDTSYQKIKDTILKKHKLHLSPQFVYSKKPMTNMDKKSEEVVTSKFFDDKNNEEKNEEAEIIKSPNNNNVCNKNTLQIKDAKEVQNKTVESPKIKETSFEHKDMPISGFLFNHGPDGIIQLSNTSMNTTGYDGENDFPHYIDTSLLLSPKADLEIQENVQVLSQEVPNFLSGLRKTGFSFFGSITNDEVAASDTNTNTQQNSNFNFNFGGEEKKTRGGLFSMFR